MEDKQKSKKDLEAAKGWLAIAKEKGNNLGVQILEDLFPELRESEDERIRKYIIWHLKHTGIYPDNSINNQVEEAISWLEKQGEQKTEIEYIYPKFRIGDVIEPIKPNGNSKPVRVLSISKKIKSYCCESDDHNVYSSIPIRCENEYKLVEQKPAEWSEEDERMCQETIDWFEKKCFPYALESENPARESIKWLKSLKDRVQPQPKQEWSEEDKRRFEYCKRLIYASDKYSTEDREETVDWLKSIKPNHWKPSEEQLIDLYYAAKQLSETRPNLQILYNDIKQL